MNLCGRLSPPGRPPAIGGRRGGPTHPPGPPRASEPPSPRPRGLRPGQGDHCQPSPLPPAAVLRPAAAPPAHPVDRAALATRAGRQPRPQRRDGVPLDPAAPPRSSRTERLIATNPVRDVKAPKPRVNPEQVFGHQRTL